MCSGAALELSILVAVPLQPPLCGLRRDDAGTLRALLGELAAIDGEIRDVARRLALGDRDLADDLAQEARILLWQFHLTGHTLAQSHVVWLALVNRMRQVREREWQSGFVGRAATGSANLGFVPPPQWALRAIQASGGVEDSIWPHVSTARRMAA